MVIMLIVLTLYALSLIALLLWALKTSFQSQYEFRTNIIGLPKDWTWNYGMVYDKFYYEVFFEGVGTLYIGMDRMFLYSFLYAIGCAFMNTLVPCITAYMCARFPYKFGKVITSVVIVAMVLPIVGSLPSEIQVARFLGLYDHIWGLWIMKGNFLGMYYLVFLGVFKGIPKEFDEAAKIDGAGEFTVMTRIILPVVSNTFFTVMLLYFIQYWNDYQTPLVYLPHYPTIALGLSFMSISTDYEMSSVPARMTAAMLLLIPILVVFLFAHKRLIGNLTVGGIKG